jgi:hypothetical protein
MHNCATQDTERVEQKIMSDEEEVDEGKEVRR